MKNGKSANTDSSLDFVKIRDKDQAGGKEYSRYTKRIGDADRLQWLIPRGFLELDEIPRSLRILDMCSGPGMAGCALDRHLRENGHDVENVTFVDAEQKRLDRVPKDPRYKTECGNVLEYTGNGFNIAILRSAAYYFTREEQSRLFSNIRNSLEHPGSFLLTTYGFVQEARTVLTELHRQMLEPRFRNRPSLMNGRGEYEAPDVIAKSVCDQGFSHGTIVDLGPVHFTVQEYAKKYTLTERRKRRLEKYLRSLPLLEDEPVKVGDGVDFLRASAGAVLNVTQRGRSVGFDAESYTVEFLTRKQKSPLKNVLYWADYLTYFFTPAGYPHSL
ncbi:MAG TPA: hypothetical protein VJA47_05680 [archaeon]|nr:hypothetical protein [archaeon]